jgi:hypothetical protein
MEGLFDLLIAFWLVGGFVCPVQFILRLITALDVFKTGLVFFE